MIKGYPGYCMLLCFYFSVWSWILLHITVWCKFVWGMFCLTVVLFKKNKHCLKEKKKKAIHVLKCLSKNLVCWHIDTHKSLNSFINLESLCFTSFSHLSWTSRFKRCCVSLFFSFFVVSVSALLRISVEEAFPFSEPTIRSIWNRTAWVSCDTLSGR